MDRKAIGRAMMALGAFVFLGALAFFLAVGAGLFPCDGYLCSIGQALMAMFVAACAGAFMGLGLWVAPRGTTPLWALLATTAAIGYAFLPAGLMFAVTSDAWLLIAGVLLGAASLVGVYAAGMDWLALWRRRRDARSARL